MRAACVAARSDDPWRSCALGARSEPPSARWLELPSALNPASRARGPALFHRLEKARRSEEFAASPVTAALHRSGMIACMLGAHRGGSQGGRDNRQRLCGSGLLRCPYGAVAAGWFGRGAPSARPIRASPVAAYRLPRWRAAAGLALSARGAGSAKPRPIPAVRWADRVPASSGPPRLARLVRPARPARLIWPALSGPPDQARIYQARIYQGCD